MVLTGSNQGMVSPREPSRVLSTTGHVVNAVGRLEDLLSGLESQLNSYMRPGGPSPKAVPTPTPELMSPHRTELDAILSRIEKMCDGVAELQARLEV